VYQIYPRSFSDASGDGIGDLEGIRRHLDHLEWLGVDAVWLSPINPSPMADFGYDVSDYCDIEPLFGSLEGFDALVAELHGRGMRVLLDWVPNHTSDRHAWFAASRSSRDDPKRDWYVWHDPAPGGGPPNDWVAAFTGESSAWTFDAASGQYYLHLFLPEQPDLNWRNPEVVAAMHDVLRFWLDRGVDGFRMDVIHAIVKRADYADAGDAIQQMITEDRYDVDAVHERLRAIRTLLDSYPGDRASVGEVFLMSTARVATYYGRDDELHMCFNFPPLLTPWDAAKWRRRVDRVVEELDPLDAWPTWVLSNHDQPRQRTRYGSDARARVAAVLLLTLRGTPFLYAGEELGLEDAIVPPERVVDPGGRDGCRAPIPWAAAAPHGWDGAAPWLPWPPEPAGHSVEALRGDPASILHLYRRVLAARRTSAALQTGDFTWLPSPDDVLAYERTSGGDRRRVFLNFSAAPQTIERSGDGWIVEVATGDRLAGSPAPGTLEPDEALILRPA
jgi:alpha-glucosidase